MDKPSFIPYNSIQFDEKEMTQRSKTFYQNLNLRRSVRDFSNQDIPREVIEKIIMTAASAPSGAHKQPWTFCAVNNPLIKSEIKKAAEKEEYESYHKRMSEEWLNALKPIGTNWQKPFLEIAPWLIIVFKKAYDLDENGARQKNYYVNESVGIACGFLISAIHQAGLVTLTHTPSPMNFLQKILNRPENERPYLLLPVGYPSDDAKVPNFDRKSADEVIRWY
ncbi:MAG: nitroreductase family protein [Saprospiraceae bacterium]